MRWQSTRTQEDECLLVAFSWRHQDLPGWWPPPLYVVVSRMTGSDWKPQQKDCDMKTHRKETHFSPMLEQWRHFHSTFTNTQKQRSQYKKNWWHFSSLVFDSVYIYTFLSYRQVARGVFLPHNTRCMNVRRSQHRILVGEIIKFPKRPSWPPVVDLFFFFFTGAQSDFIFCNRIWN